MTDVELNGEAVSEELVEKEMTIAEAFRETVKEVTGCNDEQADKLARVVGTVVSETIQMSLNDQDYMRQVFNNMMISQVNANAKLANIEATINKADWVVIDEEHESSDLRVIYNGEKPFEWIFERRSDDGWTPLEMSEEGRVRMEALVGKFFDGRIERTGYIVDANLLD